MGSSSTQERFFALRAWGRTHLLQQRSLSTTLTSPCRILGNSGHFCNGLRDALRSLVLCTYSSCLCLLVLPFKSHRCALSRRLLACNGVSLKARSGTVKYVNNSPVYFLEYPLLVLAFEVDPFFIVLNEVGSHESQGWSHRGKDCHGAISTRKAGDMFHFIIRSERKNRKSYGFVIIDHNIDHTRNFFIANS